MGSGRGGRLIRRWHKRRVGCFAASYGHLFRLREWMNGKGDFAARSSWHRVAGAFTCTLASGMAVEASLVMKFFDSDAKAFLYRTGKEHLLCVTGYFHSEILVRTVGLCRSRRAVFHSRTLRFCVPVSEERAVVKIGDLSGIIDSEGK